MASESHVPPPRVVNLVLPGVVLAVFALMGYVALNPRLESSRPGPSDTSFPEPPSAPGLIGGYSRLWEDPLEAAHKIAPTPADQANTPSSPWQAIATVLGGGESDSGVAQVQHHMAKLVQGALAPRVGAAADAPSQFHVMAVLLPGEPHAESSETRRRIRYAVTSALGVAGYHLEFPDRITYVDIPLTVPIKAVASQADIVLRVPIKLYRTTDLHSHDEVPKIGRVLVVWVNESRLGSTPIASISTLLSTMFGDAELRELRSRLQFSVIGPTSSDTLLAMAREAGRPPTASSQPASGSGFVLLPFHSLSPPLLFRLPLGKAATDTLWPLNRMTIFSYRATIGGDELEEPEGVKDFVRGTVGSSVRSDLANPAAQTRMGSLRVVRTIGTDRQLVGELFHELRLRWALPEHDDDARHIVILTERDTLYGRGLRELFRYKESSTRQPDFGIPKSNLHLFTYLRGIDGQTVSDPGSGSSQSERGSRSAAETLSGYEAEMPTGPSQYDYIRRVAQQVVQLQTRLRRSGEGRISAVGVMGSDVYDKLLIMRALRKRLGNAVYFTTDLDAALSHATEYDSTHNLVVTSHFGRQLHPSLQREAPVFRDSYQTSCFLTTLWATEDGVADLLLVDEESKRDPWRLAPRRVQADQARYLSPLTFEISRTGPFQLTSTKGPWYSDAWYEQLRGGDEREATVAGLVHPPGDRSVQLVSGDGVALAIVSTLLIMLLLAANFSAVRELLTSLWNAAVRFRRLQPETIDWVLILTVLAAAVLIGVITLDIFRSNGEPFTLVGGVSIWPTVILRAAAAALAGYFAIKAVRDVRDREARIAADFHLATAESPTDKDPSANTSAVRLLLIQPLQFLMHPKEWRDLLPDRIYRDDAPDDEPIAAIWQRLTERTQVESIVARVTPQILLFILFAYYLSPLGDPRSQPIRGDVAHVAEWISFLASLFGIIVLTFVVLDLTQCSRYFAKAIRKAGSFPWPDQYVSEQSAGNKTPAELIAYRATIEALALLSKTFSKLILYPSVVLVILILAHLSIFDNWTIPWPLLVQIALCVFAAIYGNFSLRNEVRKVRVNVLRQLRRRRFAATQTATGKELQQFDQVMDEIGAERGGAFRPLTEDPLIQAISLPFGGVGGAVLLEEFFRSIG